MTDIALTWIDASADVAIGLDDVLWDEGLQTAVMLSLFCEARVTEAELPDGETHPHGWWGDSYAEASNDSTGSKLWTLWRCKRDSETLRRAKQYATESLQWMIDDGVARAVDVATSFESLATLNRSATTPNEFALVIEVAITKPDGTREAFRFAYLWQQQQQVA